MRLVFLAAGLLLCGADVACAATPAPDHPWLADNRTINRTIADVHDGGIGAVAPHVADLEKALAGAKRSMEIAAAGDAGHVYAFVADPGDPPPEAAKAAADAAKKKLIVEPNPYLEIAFFLATYYELDNKPADALRVIDVALALPGSDANPHRTDLVSKRAAELGSLKRWTESLTAYDEALKDKNLATAVRAYLSRGRGMALYELGRKSEAKDAYLESLKLVANDPEAKKELEMIEQNQDGGQKLPPSVNAFQVPADSAPPAQSSPPKP
ncbi:MAG TPA: hypothetical protein VMF58_12170 [Rhizomicrobium sp.]|nr:hypothetical protein [Rhizomicrobium sp.]